MPRIDQEDWYNTPLYYDIVFAEDTNTEAAFLEDVWHRHGGYERKWLQVFEPACGSGRLMEALAMRGHKVSGFDASEPMLAYARKRGGGDGVFCARMEDFVLPRDAKFDLAHCLVSTFKYLLSEAHALAHLKRVAGCLEPGGLYVLGLHLSDYSRTKVQHERWTGGRDGVEVVCNTRTWPADAQARRENLRTRLRVTENGRTRTQETHWQFRTYDAAQLKALLRKVPAFEVADCYDFWCDIESPRALDDSQEDLVVVLRRRGGSLPR